MLTYADVCSRERDGGVGNGKEEETWPWDLSADVVEDGGTGGGSRSGVGGGGSRSGGGAQDGMEGGTVLKRGEFSEAGVDGQVCACAALSY